MKFFKFIKLFMFLNVFSSAFCFVDGDEGGGAGDKPSDDSSNDVDDDSSNDEIDRGKEKYKNDLIKYKKEAAENARRAQELEDKFKKQEQQKLLDASNYKELSENLMSENEQLKNNLSLKEQSWADDKKFQAIEREAIKAGINDDMIDMLRTFDTSEVQIETTSTGASKVLGATDFVENLKRSRVSMFGTKKVSGFNGGGNGSFNDSSTITMKQLDQLKAEDYKKYEKAFLSIKAGKLKIK